MTTESVLTGAARWHVEQSDDCLDVLRSMPTASVDAVVTDPPYDGIGASVSSLHKGRDGLSWSPPDTQFFFAWLREHIAEWRRVLRPSGCVWMTLDARTAFRLEDLAFKMNLRRPSVGIWDRDRMGMGGTLRSQYEAFVVWPFGDWEPPNKSTTNLWRETWGPTDREHHKAEKPPALMAKAIRFVAPPGGTILDPFAGSGTTGVAAMRDGFRFIGVEREAEYVEIARKRIAAAESPAQGSLPGAA